MEQIIEVLKEIRDELKHVNLNVEKMNRTLQDIQGEGDGKSIRDLYEKIEQIRGSSSLSELDEVLGTISGKLNFY